MNGAPDAVMVLCGMPIKMLTLALAGFLGFGALAGAAAAQRAQDPCRLLTGRERADCNHEQARAGAAANKAIADERKAQIRAQTEANRQAVDAQRPVRSAPVAPARRPEPSPEEVAAKAAKNEAGTGAVMIDRKQYAEAVPHLTAACDGGNAEGCYMLGELYDAADGVPMDKPRAVILFDKGCTGGVTDSCVRAGDIYAGGKDVAVDKEQQLKYYRTGCQGVGIKVGRIQGCEHWAALEPGADVKWVASLLTDDPNVGTTLQEQNLVMLDPRAMGQLCAAHTMRACFALRQTLEDLHLADVMGNPEHHITRASFQPAQTALLNLCKGPVMDNNPREHEAYCRVSHMVDYAIVHNFGPASEDPTKCVRIAGTYTTTDYYWVDRDGHKTYKDSSHRPEGTNVQNDCPYAVDYADFAGDVVTLHPHELYQANLEINEILTGFNAPKVRYIRKHDAAARPVKARP